MNEPWRLVGTFLGVRTETSRVGLFGRNWNFAGRSAEPIRLDGGNHQG